ncbi:MAG TPA: hypothetical protein VMT19_09945 [Thermoanaerobaculaceae bacterium]|nr:hypothetical protein [Thermoanaerobaculaceae bacterium]
MQRITVRLLCTVMSVAAFGTLSAPAAQPDVELRSRSVVAITVCSPDGTAGQGSCPAGTSDTQQIVLGPSGASINLEGVHAVSDEHSSVFPPGSLGGNSDYRFFVAAGTDVNPDIGVVVLSGGSGPAANGQWTVGFAPGYGSYSEGYGAVFLEPLTESHCPSVSSATQQDPTFDLNYAASGSVVPDVTDLPGHLLMIYEGTETCIGSTGGTKAGTGAYITTGVATSFDNGVTWPSYRGTSTFNFVPLPHSNKTNGPNLPFGALGAGVCFGIDCTQTPPATYGRYAVLSPPVSMASLIATGAAMGPNTADSEPSAFVDDASPGPDRYVYEVHTHNPGSAAPTADQFPDGRTIDLTVARAQLNGGSAPLQFTKWDGRGFSSLGIGGHEVAILPDGAFESCGTLDQTRTAGSISYVEDTQQYLLTFVCSSPGDPANGSKGGDKGAAWFWATSRDLSDQTLWSTPQEVLGSWTPFDTGTPAGSYGCSSFQGWYPTLMSLDHAPGHLATRGYVFYLWGCEGGGGPNGNPPKRQYSSRRFTIAADSVVRREARPEAH